MAVSFINVARKLHFHIPNDIQVIGFQNTRYASLSNPKLTCVDTPIYEIGNVAMSKLTEEMQSDELVKPTTTVVDYKIVWRDSTK
jgi:LacI family transcriptional regulator